MNKIIIIGANELQKPLVDKANDLGLKTHVFAWEQGAVAKKTADYFYPISIRKKEQILSIAKKIKPNGVCSIASDLAVPTVNFLANELGLPSNSNKCSLLSTNKFEMRKVFEENNISSPKYKIVENDNIIMNKLKFPLIVKPVDRSGSRGIYKVNNIKTLENAIKNAIEISFVKKAIIEEYIVGQEFSVEMISQNGNHNFLQLTQKKTTGTPHFVESAHFAPVEINPKLKLRIINMIKDALNALEIKNGASHSEIKINNMGEIFIIEIGSRMGGDFIGSNMVEITTGINFIEKIIDISVGNTLFLKKQKKEKFSIVKFILNHDDLDKFKHLKNKYPNIIDDYKINNKLNEKIYDSTSRNGSYVLNINEKNLYDKIINFLKLNNDLYK